MNTQENWESSIFDFDDSLMTQVIVPSTKVPKKPSKKNKKQKYQDIMKVIKPTCYSCSTHSDDYLRLVPQPLGLRPTCKSCGTKCLGKYGYLVCAKSAACYVLCSSCRVCSSNHMLRKINTLKHLTDNALYANDRFKCHGCKKEKNVGLNGVWHCQACAFSICAECVVKTDNILTEKAQLQNENNQN